MTDKDMKAEFEALKQDKQRGSRLDSDAGQKDDRAESPVDQYVRLLGEIESGDGSDMLAVRDSKITAFFELLEESGEMQAFGEELQSFLGRPSGEVGRSELLRLMFRVSIKSAAEERFDLVQKGIGEYARRTS